MKEQPTPVSEKKETEQPSSSAAIAVKETESSVQAQASVEPQQTEESKPQQTEESKPQQTEESKPQQTATPTDAVDTSLAVLEARCKRFGIPFDPSKYTKRANSRPSKADVNESGRVHP